MAIGGMEFRDDCDHNAIGDAEEGTNGMQLHVHQTLSAIPIIPFASAGIIAGAYLAHRLGLWKGNGGPADVLAWVVALGLMIGIGWVASLPIQWVYDRFVPARCPGCGSNTAYRQWPSIRWYRCRACQADSKV